MTRAAFIDTPGTPPSVREHTVPEPGPDQAVVRVTAASITPLDVLCASGTSYFGVPVTPYVPGVQGVGHLADGTAVWFATPAGMRPGDGSLAERTVVARTDLVPLPDGVPHGLIAALGLSAVAALMALTWRGRLQPEEQVLVLGAGGVVGQAAIQLALLHGARRVIAACRSEAAAARARAAGAAEVVLLGTADVPGLTARMKHAADGPVDLVLDPVFGVPAAAALRTLRPGGRLVNLGSAAGATAPLESTTLRGGSLDVLGYTNNDLTVEQRADAIKTIAGYVRTGRLTVDHEQVPLADIGAAWQRADRRMVVIP